MEKKLARIAAGKTQIMLQLETGIQTSQISLYKRNLIQPSPEHAKKLNMALNRYVYDETPQRKFRSLRKRGVRL
jgi:hypothetical protein